MAVGTTPGRQRAVQEAERLLDRLGVDEPPARDPDRLVDLVRQAGPEVIPKPLEKETSGLLVWRDDGSAVIGVNSRHPSTRRHFTIAHELGHWALHSEDSGVFIDEFTVHYRGDGSSDQYDPRESEANAFAAAFLMPARMLREDLGEQRIDASDDDQLRSLADRYGVSLQALTIRLTNLDLLAF